MAGEDAATLPSTKIWSEGEGRRGRGKGEEGVGRELNKYSEQLTWSRGSRPWWKWGGSTQRWNPRGNNVEWDGEEVPMILKRNRLNSLAAHPQALSFAIV